jgi:hypothetical protein
MSFAAAGGSKNLTNIIFSEKTTNMMGSTMTEEFQQLVSSRWRASHRPATHVT